MLLYLLRHADAEASAESGAARALTEKGVEQAKRVGRFCRKNELKPDMILSSPFRRAEQTAKLAAEKMENDKVQIAEFLASGMQPGTAIAELKNYAESSSVMMVGHEPDFSSLTAKLLGTSQDRIQLKKASLTAIELDENDLSRGTLLFSLPVRLMPS